APFEWRSGKRILAQRLDVCARTGIAGHSFVSKPSERGGRNSNLFGRASIFAVFPRHNRTCGGAEEIMSNSHQDASSEDSRASGDESRIVWHRHVRAARAGDIDAVMSDFTDRSAVITSDAVLAGRSEIRAFFEKLLGGLDQQAHESTVMNAELVHE